MWMVAPSNRKKFGVTTPKRTCSGVPSARKHGSTRGQDAGEILERVLIRFAQIEILGVGKRKVLDVALSHVAASDDQPFGIFIGKRPQQHRVGNAENRRAGPDPERDGEHRRSQEKRDSSRATGPRTADPS